MQATATLDACFLVGFLRSHRQQQYHRRQWAPKAKTSSQICSAGSDFLLTPCRCTYDLFRPRTSASNQTLIVGNPNSNGSCFALSVHSKGWYITRRSRLCGSLVRAGDPEVRRIQRNPVWQPLAIRATVPRAHATGSRRVLRDDKRTA